MKKMIVALLFAMMGVAAHAQSFDFPVGTSAGSANGPYYTEQAQSLDVASGETLTEHVSFGRTIGPNVWYVFFDRATWSATNGIVYDMESGIVYPTGGTMVHNADGTYTVTVTGIFNNLVGDHAQHVYSLNLTMQMHCTPGLSGRASGVHCGWTITQDGNVTIN